MNSKEILNVAMIGHGFMGRAHSNAFQQVNRFFDTRYDVRRKVICGRNRANLEAMATQWGWEEIDTDWSAVIKRRDIQVIDVAAPNFLHAEIAIAAAEAGKIVFCEKPLAMSLEEAKRMANAVKQVPNLVWFNYRRVPAIALAKNLIDQGKLGHIYHYRATYLQSWGTKSAAELWRFKRCEAGSGVIGDLLSHLVDTALVLNGNISELCGMTTTFAPGREVDDAALLLARFENRSVGTFEATRYAIGHHNRNSFTIHGSGGMIRFNLEDLNRLEFFDNAGDAQTQGISNFLVTQSHHPYVGNFWPPGHIIGYEHTFIATLADFLKALSSGEAFHPNFEDALQVQRVLSAVEHSSSSRTWVTVAPE